MTILVKNEEPDSWTTPPGWGIYADLTPPELLNARRLKSIRRILLAVLIAAVVLALAGYAYAIMNQRSAASAVAQQTALTAQLQADQGRYTQVTAIKGSISQVQAQLAGLLVGDVDFGGLVRSVHAGLPARVSLNQFSITIDSSGAAAADAGAGAGSIDTGTHAVIGMITVGGTAASLELVADYVTALGVTTGITDVVPTTSQVTAAGVTYSITMSVTDVVLTHKYDLVATSAPAATAAATAAAAASGATTTPAAATTAAAQ